MSATKTVFVTGGTGFVGSFLIAHLLRQGCRVVALVRSPDPLGRLLAVLREVSESAIGGSHLTGRLRVVEGDVRLPGFGLTPAVQGELACQVEELWHCATSFKFQERDREEVISHNVQGARHLLDFACCCNSGKTAPVFYVSTICAAPVRGGISREELPPVDAPFRNLYEWSKQEAERLVNQFRQAHQLPAMILRPSIIIGDSRTGKAVRFTAYYGVFRALYLLARNLEVNLGSAFDRNLRLRILAQPDLRLNLAPIDFVVDALWRVSRAVRQGQYIYHIANDTTVPLTEMIETASADLGVTGIEIVGEQSFRERPMTGFERLFKQRAQFQAPYLLASPRYDTSNFRRLVSPAVLPCPAVDERLLRQVNTYYRRVLDQQFQMPPTAPAFRLPLTAPTLLSPASASDPVLLTSYTGARGGVAVNL